MLNYVQLIVRSCCIPPSWRMIFVVSAWSTVAGPGDDRRSLGTKQVQATKAWDLEKLMEIGGSSELVDDISPQNRRAMRAFGLR